LAIVLAILAVLALGYGGYKTFGKKTVVEVDKYEVKCPTCSVAVESTAQTRKEGVKCTKCNKIIYEEQTAKEIDEQK
jgi:phage FluMu protein Com